METVQPQMPPPALVVPKTDGMAVTSLVLGIIGICCCFLTGIVALILGLKSRKRIRESNGMLTGDGVALAGVITGCISLATALFQIGILAGMLLPAIGQARESANRVKCSHTLRSIGLACKQYAQDDDKGMLPPGFKTLMSTKYVTDAYIFACPSSGARGTARTVQPVLVQQFPSSGARPAASVAPEQDYLYFGAGLKEMEVGSDTVLAVDAVDNHRGMFINVLFGDCHIEGVRVPKGTDFRTIAAQKGWKIPAPGGK